MYRIIRTEDYYPLAVLFDVNGLHADPDEGRDEDSIALWRCELTVDEQGNETDEGRGVLIGGAELCFKAGVYVLQHIAVYDEFKGQGYGAELLRTVEDEVRSLLGESGNSDREMWLCAKVPEFYKKYAWSEVSRQEAPDFTSCFECEDFGITCKPSIMKKQM